MASLSLPGGAGQNTARVCGHLLKDTSQASISFLGCVGGQDERIDQNAQVMFDALRNVGVKAMYEIAKTGRPTGTCAVCIDRTTRDRSMCTNIGASADFSTEFAQTHWQSVEKSRILYFTGYFVTASPKTIELICETSPSRPRQLLISCLSAPFIIKKFPEHVLLWLTHSQIVVGNEEEMREVGAVLGKRLGVDENATLPEIVRAICEFAGSSEKPRIIVATCGQNPTVTASKLKGSDKARIDTFAVRKVPPELIGDTNGCGDGFCGGLIYQLLQVHNFSAMTLNQLAQAIEMGHLCGGEVLQHTGCRFLGDFHRVGNQ